MWEWNLTRWWLTKTYDTSTNCQLCRQKKKVFPAVGVSLSRRRICVTSFNFENQLRAASQVFSNSRALRHNSQVEVPVLRRLSCCCCSCQRVEPQSTFATAGASLPSIYFYLTANTCIQIQLHKHRYINSQIKTPMKKHNQPWQHPVYHQRISTWLLVSACAIVTLTIVVTTVINVLRSCRRRREFVYLLSMFIMFVFNESWAL